MSNHSLPSFNTIDSAHFPQQLERMLHQHLQHIDELLKANAIYTWDNLIAPLEAMDDALERFWSPLSHLRAVVSSNELRACYEACLPHLSAYETAISHNKELYQGIKSIDHSLLNDTQKKIISDKLKDFELAGVGLEPTKKQRLEVIEKRLMQLSSDYENHVLDAGLAYEYHVTEKKRLAGLPKHIIHQAHTLANEKGQDGWLFNLEMPTYVAVMTYADDRLLRKTLYEAFVTRASDAGPNAGKFDNTLIIDEILALRHEKAILLGFPHYAELSLATKMANSSAEVLSFLSHLNKQVHSQALQEFNALETYAKEQIALYPLAPWDIAYASEKKCQAEHAVSQEALRPYFPLPKVMAGLVTILNRLYGLSMKKVSNVDVWHKDVICYQLQDETGAVCGYLYMDLFARPHKRDGAWMDSFQSRRQLADGRIQLPIASLTCNFTKPLAGKSATLSHDEVVTLFHEMGHCLHHLLTQVDYLSVSGTHGVEWDAVELPSQFFENWCWQEEAVHELTEHVDTKKPLPQIDLEHLLAAKNFQSAMALARQLEFSLFDFRLHQEFVAGKPNLVARIIQEVREQTAVVPIASYNRFQHAFTHIFAGGYAAGYYSYLWAEVLSSDAFARFEEEGLFNPQTGRDFLNHILAVGGSVPAAKAYEAFRGRTPTVDALLRHHGIDVVAPKT